MTSPLNEAAVEQAAIDWLKGLDWQYAYGPDIGPDGATPERESYGQVVLEQWVVCSLVSRSAYAQYLSTINNCRTYGLPFGRWRFARVV